MIRDPEPTIALTIPAAAPAARIAIASTRFTEPMVVGGLLLGLVRNLPNASVGSVIHGSRRRPGEVLVICRRHAAFGKDSAVNRGSGSDGRLAGRLDIDLVLPGEAFGKKCLGGD